MYFVVSTIINERLLLQNIYIYIYIYIKKNSFKKYPHWLVFSMGAPAAIIREDLALRSSMSFA